MFRFLHEDWKLLKNGGKNMVLFELAYKLIATAVIYPLVLLVLNGAIRIAGIKYLTNEYIVRFLSNPVVILLIFSIVLAFCIYAIYEMIFISSCYEFKRRDIKISFIASVATSFVKMKKLMHFRHLLWFFYTFLSFIAINITIIGNFVISGSSVDVLGTYVAKSHWWTWGIVAILLIAIYVPVILGTFAMNIFVLEGDSYKKAYIKSTLMVKKHMARVIITIVVYNMFILIAIGVIYVIISMILIIGVKVLDMAYIGSAIYLSAIRIIGSGVKLITVYIAVPCSYTAISRLYYKICDEDEIDYAPVKFTERHLKRNRTIFGVIFTVAIILDSTYAIMSFNNNPFDRVAIFSDIHISSHRGSLKEAPENTIAAFEKAIEDMTDYIELDVQQTSDGAIIVMHDANAYRTTGVDKDIYQMTLEEVKSLDAGSFFSKDYAGEQVPTLEEVIQYVKGKAKLNIEIKPNSHDSNIEEEVVAIIEKNNFENDCVITSFNYETLKNVKQLNGNIDVGYILSVAYGDFYNMSDVDFFSVNASFLTKRTVDAIHNSGKQVHAWTVNNSVAIKNLANKGVDNIITDDPIAAKEVIYSRNTSETLINMIKYVFNR